MANAQQAVNRVKESSTHGAVAPWVDDAGSGATPRRDGRVLPTNHNHSRALLVAAGEAAAGIATAAGTAKGSSSSGGGLCISTKDSAAENDVVEGDFLSLFYFKLPRSL